MYMYDYVYGLLQIILGKRINTISMFIILYTKLCVDFKNVYQKDHAWNVCVGAVGFL